jgi:hypothetical protein
MVPVARLARWAAASMPRASPETTARPASPSSRASLPASLIPAAEAGADHGDHRALQHGEMAA